MSTLEITPIIITIFTGAMSVALAFYIKEYLQKRSNFSNLRKKLDQIAGKNAFVIYNPGHGIGMGPQLYKIIAIDQHGVTLKNEIHTIYVPASKLIDSDIVLPSDDYDNARLAKMKKDFEEIADSIVPPMMEKMIPVMRNVFIEEFMEEGGEFSAVIGIKIQRALESEGYEIIKKDIGAKKARLHRP